MKYLLDTNACIEQLRGEPTSVIAARLAIANPADVVLCSVVVAELLYGAARSAQRTRNLSEVQKFCSRFFSLPFDDAAADAYGPLRADLDQKGQTIGPHDLLIASIALAHGLTLVTHNTAEFSRVSKLSIEDWQSP